MKLIIIGAGDFAAVAKVYFDHDSEHEVVAFAVTRGASELTEFEGLPVAALDELVQRFPPADHGVFVAVAYSQVNKNRERLFEEARALGYSLPAYVCSKATTWPGLTVGEGSFIFENNVIQPFVKIGKNTILWSGNHIGHHSVIGDHVFMASHVVVSGNCRIEDNCFIGVNATLRDGIAIGHHSVIGAGALVLHNIKPEHLVRGERSKAKPMDIDKQTI